MNRSYSLAATLLHWSYTLVVLEILMSPTYGTIRQLRLFIDRCSIEAFDTDGKMAMTNLVFPSEPYNTIKVKGGKATIYDIKR